MKSLFKIVILLLIISALSACKVVTVGPGQQAVETAQPLLWGHGGVFKTPVLPGSAYAAGTTHVTLVSMVPQTIHVSFRDYSTHDRFLLNFDTSVQLRVTDSVALVTQFGADWFKNNVESQYDAMVRDLVKGQDMQDMMSNPVTAVTMEGSLTKQLDAYIKANHIPVQLMNITIGRAVPNDAVLAQMNETAAQEQRKNTLIAATAAEDERALSEKARAAADDAYRQQIGYSVDQYAAMQIANINADACKAAKSCILTPAGTRVLVQ